MAKTYRALALLLTYPTTDLQRLAPGGMLRHEFGSRSQISPLIGNPDQFGVGINSPSLAIIQHVEGAIIAEGHVHGPLDLEASAAVVVPLSQPHRIGEREYLLHFGIRAQSHPKLEWA